MNMKNNNYKIVGLIVFVSLIVLAWAAAKPYRISGDCMEPAIKDGQTCFLNRISPYIRQYQIGDIIAFKHDGIDWFSRIVALENDMIHITEGSIVVNGVALKDIGIHRNWSHWKLGIYGIDSPFQVPLDHVYVLSDNLSAQHDDSRVFGPISKKSITGVIW
jgi:signal peptidase I